ncbi:DUF262 domain-containing protein [Mesorhizobium sp. M0011]|uniref:DUF262 domain-containing protein n=1 Tax=Mesorhizobium sp. M0011 TaxID=2956839 RepID=UPI00333DD38D
MSAALQTPLNASASTAGALFSSTTFEVPEFQREYSWALEEVSEFWADLQMSLEAETYFLGLVILTNPSGADDGRKHVVDGQQRLITLSLLATAIFHEAMKRGRQALADRIQADFLRSIDYESDDTAPRVELSDAADDATFQALLTNGNAPVATLGDPDSVSSRMVTSYNFLARKLSDDLKSDPFKRLGKWTDFITNRLYFAVFVHPDAASAYQVFEVINTRGKDLTTADLLKNYVLSQTIPAGRSDRYTQWRSLSRQFPNEGANNFVQFIRHVVTVRSGHVLPKDLFGFLAGRLRLPGRTPPVPDDLMTMLEGALPRYQQMIDPTLAGPSEPQALSVYSALNSLGVIAVRPILLAMSNVPDSIEGMRYILKLVVRRIIVGNLGTGNVERRLGEAARNIRDSNNWQSIIHDLRDLNPTKDQFVDQLRKRSFNKQVLQFLRRSIVQDTIVPGNEGVLHFIWTRQSDFDGMDEDEGSFWASTIGNSFLSTLDRRPKDVTNWATFKQYMLSTGVVNEWVDRLQQVGEWDAAAVDQVGAELADAAGEIWY